MRRHLAPSLVVSCIALFVALSGTSYAATPVRSEPLLIPATGHSHASTGGRRQVLIIGDSLTSGVTGLMPRVLPGWKIGINGMGGRPLKVGMNLLDGWEVDEDTVLIMGLFTNNPPGDFPNLRSAVRESLRRVGDNGCVVWNTVYRPAVGGPSWQPAWTPTEQIGMGYAKVNAWLRSMAESEPRMRLVDWSRSLHRSPMRMDPTGVHPAAAAGWQRRAQMFADAARSC